ncbi:MAG: phage major capsid protein [Porphyromonadaceae bacterium]|nr:phage major capsid protein [Porphyromonadaceae bacterium]
MDKKKKIEQLRSELDGILEQVAQEQRKLTNDEETRLEDLRKDIALLTAQRFASGELEEEPTREQGVGLTKVLREMMDGRYSDGTQAILERGAQDMKRSLGISGGIYIPMDLLGEARSTLTVGGTGGKTVSTEIQPILAPLYANLVFARAGAKIMTGLQGNIRFPRYSGTTSNWVEETGTSLNGEGTISHLEFSPKGLTTLVEFSEQLLMQDDAGVEAMIRREITQSIQAKLEATALGKADGNGGKQPVGLFHGEVTNKGKADNARMIAMETAVAESNALLGNLAYITSPKGVEVLRTVHKDKAGMAFLSDGNTLNGYPLLATTGVAKEINAGEEGILFGNFADFLIGQWGGMSITCDRLTKASNGIVRYIIRTFFDFGFIRPESYQKATIKA